MQDGPRRFPQDFTCPVVLRKYTMESANLSPTGLSPCIAGLSRAVRLDCGFVTPPQGGDPRTRTPTTPTAQRSPAITYSRFGLFPVRSPLLGESRLISFPGGTEMVHFPPFASASYEFRVRMTRHYPRRVSPFGHPRIDACLRLPEAYRSLLRPSSPTNAKASTACPL